MFSCDSRGFGKTNNTKQKEKSETTGRIKGKMSGLREGRVCGSAIQRERKRTIGNVRDCVLR